MSQAPGLEEGRSVVEQLFGDTTVGKVIRGDPDPTVQEFQQSKQDIGNSFANFFKGFHFLGDKRIWLVVAAVIVLVLFAIIRG